MVSGYDYCHNSRLCISCHRCPFFPLFLFLLLLYIFSIPKTPKQSPSLLRAVSAQPNSSIPSYKLRPPAFVESEQKPSFQNDGAIWLRMNWICV